ncbi:MAG: RNA polymerase sigma factor [Acetivibrionales bacterium]|jgi:RNA polymerase sigma-70 factor (ECF subfamily)
MGKRMLNLLQKAKKGDIKSYEIMIEQYEQRVFSAAYELTGDRNAANELAQEVFVRVYRSIIHIDDDSLLELWIYRTVKKVYTEYKSIYNETCLMRMRKQA